MDPLSGQDILEKRKISYICGIRNLELPPLNLITILITLAGGSHVVFLHTLSFLVVAVVVLFNIKY